MKRYLLAIALAVCGITLVAQQAPAPDRTRPPQPGVPPALTLPALQKLQLSNGLPVWLVELHEVPVAQVNLLIFSGTADDPAGKFGVASLTAAMLQEGAGSRSSLELADAIDFLGADLTVTGGSDASAVRLHVPVARLADALPIMADVAFRPTFPRDELERLRTERLTNILQARDNAATINTTAFSRILYGPTHRYGTPAAGTAATLRSISVDDLRAYYATAFHPRNAALIVVGDVTPARVLPLLESSFGRWTAAAAATPARIPDAPQHALRIIYLVDKPGAPQSQIRIGWIGVPRSTPDYFPIEVMNTMLGGSFSSRLNLNLREKNGYTYGAGSGFDMRLSAGPFAAAAAVQTDKTADALREFISELNAIAARLAPADELTRAKNYLALRFPTDFESTGDISRQLENLLVYRLPEDYFSKYVPSIEAVTAADAQRVARRYIQPNRFAFVITGDRNAIEPAIAALKLGQIKVVTIDEVFGPPPVIGR